MVWQGVSFAETAMSLLLRTRLKPVALALFLAGLSATSSAQVVISQVYGGGGNSGATFSHDFVELRNTSNAPVSLSGWSLQYASTSGSTWGNRVNLSGSIPANGFFLVRLRSGNVAVGTPLTNFDQDGGNSIDLAGANGKIALVNGTTALTGSCPVPSASVLDFVGYGTANCSEGSQAAPTLSNTLAGFRAAQGCTDTNVNAADFSSATPAPRTSTSVPLPPACDGNPTPPPPPPAPPPPPPPAPAPAESRTFTIQGSGTQSAMVGQTTVVPGVVTRINSNGFFIQDQTGDANLATSDGLFVFTGATTYPAVAVGNLVRVSGTVAEFSTGGSTVTQLSSVTSVALTGAGFQIVPTDITFPETVEGELERYEGMLVRINGPFTISQNSFQARYGQLTLAQGDRLQVPTNSARVGTPEHAALVSSNSRRRLILDDGSSLQYPSTIAYLDGNALPRAGDRITGSLVGVIDYGPTTTSATPGDYRLHPTAAFTYVVANPRTAAPAAVGGNIKVASFNVLNYFTTFTNGQNVAGQSGQGCSEGSSVNAGNCRGADNLDEFSRQRTKIIDALARINADAVGLMELQNNGNVAAQNLVDGLNQVLGAGTYAVAPLPTNGTGSDAIRTAVIFKPARMSALQGVSDTASINDRPTLLQPLHLHNGERFSLVVNHLKSKGGCSSSDPDLGQGCWNIKRTAQANQLRSFLSSQSGISGAAQLIVGDFNAYAKEDPIDVLTSNGFVDLVERFQPGAHSYVFNGEAGRLDHLLASNSLAAQVAGAVHWHINADEQPQADYNRESKAPLTCNGSALCPTDLYNPGPYRSSDHDPVIAGLSLYKRITAATTDTTLIGTAGDDILTSGAGRRSITTGAGFDQIVFTSSFAGAATLTDFAPGSDTISLRAPLQALGVPLVDPIAQGYLSCRVSGADALISVDTDAAGPAPARAWLLIKSANCSVLNRTNFVF